MSSPWSATPTTSSSLPSLCGRSSGTPASKRLSVIGRAHPKGCELFAVSPAWPREKLDEESERLTSGSGGGPTDHLTFWPGQGLYCANPLEYILYMTAEMTVSEARADLGAVTYTHLTLPTN